MSSFIGGLLWWIVQGEKRAAPRRDKAPAPGGNLYRRFVFNDDLAGAHGGQRRAVAFRGDPGAAGGIYNDGDLRQVSPQQQGVADDADIGAESDEGDRFNGGILIQGAQALSQGGAAKGDPQ